MQHLQGDSELVGAAFGALQEGTRTRRMPPDVMQARLCPHTAVSQPVCVRTACLCASPSAKCPACTATSGGRRHVQGAMVFVDEASSSGRLGDEFTVADASEVFRSTYELVFSTAVQIRRLQYMPIRVRAAACSLRHELSLHWAPCIVLLRMALCGPECV